MKTLNGGIEKDVFKMYKLYFKDLLRVKPKASRARSSEIYYLGKGYGQSKEYEKMIKIEEKKEVNLDIIMNYLTKYIFLHIKEKPFC